MLDKSVLRVIDANFNRCKEGLRVAEDIFRFVLCDDSLRRKMRSIRHRLDDLAFDKTIKNAISCRDSKRDIGRNFDNLEGKRESVKDILYINLQRAKESLRVLEEFFKLIDKQKASTIKKVRYQIYTLEKQILLKMPHKLSRQKKRK